MQTHKNANPGLDVTLLHVSYVIRPSRKAWAILNQCVRLASNLKWSRHPTKSHANGETGKLCIENHSVVSILVSQPWSLLSLVTENYWLHYPSCERFHVSRMNRWIAIWPMFASEYFPQFQGNWKWVLFWKCLRRVTNLDIQFQSFSDHYITAK